MCLAGANTITDSEANQNKTMAAAAPQDDSPWKMFAGFASVTTIGCLIATIILATKDNSSSTTVAAPSMSSTEAASMDVVIRGPPAGENVCAGKKIDLPNAQCVIDQVFQTGEQAGANVTKGYNGLRNTTVEPITKPYYQAGLCPVNVHWHLGAEHLSVGEYDENGKGPSDIKERRRLAGKERQGFQCALYDEADEKFTKPYEWKHCDSSMEVGQTYEVHWPHSAAGACGTLNQYQTPFYDGVFCNLDMDTLLTLQPQDIASAVGVQSQVYTIVNDEDYYYPDMIRGMIVDGEFGSDMAMYTGSTTGTSRDNEICSSYTPITWQVDRKCHMISASSFDKMCADMKAQRDDMSDDLYAHGSRELVSDENAANNHANLRA